MCYKCRSCRPAYPDAQGDNNQCVDHNKCVMTKMSEPWIGRLRRRQRCGADRRGPWGGRHFSPSSQQLRYIPLPLHAIGTSCASKCSAGARIYFGPAFAGRTDGDRRGARPNRRAAFERASVRRVFEPHQSPRRSPSACSETSGKNALRDLPVVSVLVARCVVVDLAPVVRPWLN